MQLTKIEIKKIKAGIERNKKENKKLKDRLKEGCKHVWPKRGLFQSFYDGDRRFCRKCETTQIYHIGFQDEGWEFDN